MPKKKFGLSNFIDKHFGWFAFGVFLILCLIITGGISLYNIYAEDVRVYEDNQIICYEENSSNDKPNSKQRFYCIERNTREIVCEYDWSRGSGNKPPQGCYL